MGPREWLERSDSGSVTTPHTETYTEMGHASTQGEQLPETDTYMEESGNVSNEVTRFIPIPSETSDPTAQELVRLRAWAAEAETRLSAMREQLAVYRRWAEAAEQRAIDANARATIYARHADQATSDMRRVGHHLALHHDRGVQSCHRRIVGRGPPANRQGNGPST